MKHSHIYIKIPNPDKVRKDILYVKKYIYLRIHDILEEIEKSNKIDSILNRIGEKIGEIQALLDELENKIPSEEEIKYVEDMIKKRKSKTRETSKSANIDKNGKKDSTKNESSKDFSIRRELEELSLIEKELRKIEEELRKLG